MRKKREGERIKDEREARWRERVSEVKKIKGRDRERKREKYRKERKMQT